MKELTRIIDAQTKLIELYEDQIAQLTMLSKIELGDDVLIEISTLKNEIKTGV